MGFIATLEERLGKDSEKLEENERNTGTLEVSTGSVAGFKRQLPE